MEQLHLDKVKKLKFKENETIQRIKERERVIE